jgi:hypothetical protein
VHLRCPTFQHEHGWECELHPLPHKTHLKLGRKSEPHPHTIRSQPESCLNLSGSQIYRNSKPPMGPSLRLIYVDQLTSVGSGMRLASTDCNLTLLGRSASPDGRLDSDHSQNASGLLPGGEGALGAVVPNAEIGPVIQPSRSPSYPIECLKVALQDSRCACGNGCSTLLGTCMTSPRSSCKGGGSVDVNGVNGNHCIAQSMFKLTEYYPYFKK